MAEKTTVAFRIGESVKEEWEEAAEGPEYDSLSHLIRLAVQREISGENARTEAQTDTTVEAEGEILESLNRIERVVTDVQEEVEATARESRAEELYDLEQVLLEILPTLPQSMDPAQVTPEQLDSGAASPRELAGRIGADTSDVTDALERLEENTSQVRVAKATDTDEAQYWRVE